MLCSSFGIILPLIPELLEENERDPEEEVDGTGTLMAEGGVSGTFSTEASCLI